MKYSMMTYTMARGEWGKEPDIKYLCEFTRKLGLDGVEWVTTYGKDAKEVRKIMDDYGLKTVCYTFFVDINFKEESKRQEGIEKIKKGLEEAEILGTDRIMLPVSGKDEYTREESRRNVIKVLEKAVEISKNYGIKITVEHFPDIRGPFLTSKDVNEAVKEISDLRITFDSGNVIMGGENSVDGFLNSKDFIIHSHFKDWEISQEGRESLNGKKYRAALIGEGVIDYKKLVEIMEKENYSHYVSIEYEGNKYQPEEAIEKALKFLRSLK